MDIVKEISFLKSMISMDELIEIFNNSYDGIMVTDRHGKIIFVNKAISIILDMDIYDLVGEYVTECVKKGFYDNSVINTAILSKKQHSGIVNLHNGNSVVSTSTPILNANGEVTLTVTNVRFESIIDRYAKELEKQRCYTKRYKSAINYINSIQSHTNSIVTECHKMKLLLENLIKVSKMNSTITIYGESGTGKEVISRFIHDNSTRNKEPFIPVNCGAIPKELMESEFFGYEKGAFTGAVKSKPGFFEMADFGTLFLDEIGEIPLNIQTKFLRVIESGVFQRLGGINPMKANVRIIAATNRDLKHLIESGDFREDLYYRLNVIPVSIPPLRERKEDIVPLAQHFIDQINKEYDSRKLLTKEFVDKLKCYHWPGNIRELKNVIERFYILSSEEGSYKLDDGMFTSIRNEDNDLKGVDISSIANKFSGDLKSFVKEAEKEFIINALERYRWHISDTADYLNIHRSMLYRKMKEYQIDRRVE